MTDPQNSQMLYGGLSMDEVAPDDAWVSRMLKQSSLPGQIGMLVGDDVLTTDDTITIHGVNDASGSVVEVVDAIVEGIEGNLKANPPRPGLYDELRKVRGSDRQKFRISMVRFSSGVEEVYPLVPLFIMDPNTKPGEKPREIRNPEVKALNAQTYFRGMGGATNTILAIQKTLADAIGYDAVMAHPDFDQVSKHVLWVLSDGFCNLGTTQELRELRKTIKRLRQSEAWTFLFFFVATPDTVEMFESTLFDQDTLDKVQKLQWTAQAARANVDSYLDRLIQSRQFLDDTQVSSSGNRYTARQKAMAQLMFEAMGTGWASFTETENDVYAMTGARGEMAQLYLLAEKAIVRMLGGDRNYTAQGGLCFPAENVSTIFFEPEAIAQMLGMEVSSSIIRHSIGIGGAAPQVPAQQTPSPAPTTPPDPATNADQEDEIF